MTDKQKRLEDVTFTCNIEPWPGPDEEAMCEAIKDQIQQELFEWQRTTTKIPYDDGPFKGLLGKALRKAFASAIGVDDNGQCLLTEMEYRASGDKLDGLAGIVGIERMPGEPDDSLRRRWLGERARFDPLGSGPDLPSEYEEPRWSFPVLPGLTPAEPAVAMATLSQPITWTTGPGKQTARNGDREARLTKGGLYWYAEGHVDLQWGAKSLGASRDVVKLKQAAKAWLKGDASWDEYQRDLVFDAVYDEHQAELDEGKKREIALDTLRQSDKK